jgi:hypothetical protein
MHYCAAESENWDLIVYQLVVVVNIFGIQLFVMMNRTVK